MNAPTGKTEASPVDREGLRRGLTRCPAGQEYSNCGVSMLTALCIGCVCLLCLGLPFDLTCWQVCSAELVCYRNTGAGGCTTQKAPTLNINLRGPTIPLFFPLNTSPIILHEAALAGSSPTAD
jgi:hypothetical protein